MCEKQKRIEELETALRESRARKTEIVKTKLFDRDLNSAVISRQLVFVVAPMMILIVAIIAAILT